MTHESPRLLLGRFRPVDLARLLWVVLPGAPGLLFILAGLVCDPHWSVRGPSTVGQAAYDRANIQAHELYLAGAVTLLGGTLAMAVVVWKIARTRPDEEDGPRADDPE